jgi:bifunctional non-homologous end joining protein LigD
VKEILQTAGKKSVAGVVLSNPDRILYPEQGVTKQDLAAYYEKIGDLILPHLMNRPLSLVRCPAGHQKQCFYQKHLTDQLPDTLLEVPIREKGEQRAYIALKDLAGLISLVQLGVLEIHPWGGRRDNLERPDRMIFDLDPGPGVKPRQMVKVTRLLHSFLYELGLVNFLKASGGKGFHVVVPLDRRAGWNEVKNFAKKVAEQIAAVMPDHVTAVMQKSERQGKIFIDYLRNTRGATTVAPYSTRARSGAPVSAPIGWEALKPSLRPDQFTVQNILSHIAERPSDPWSGFFGVHQSLTNERKKRLGL